MKTLHRLAPRVTMLKDFYVFDVETGVKNKDGSIQWLLRGRPDAFQFGVIYGHNYTKIIYSVDEFKETLKDSRFKNLYMFGHNVIYDLNTIYGNIFTVDPTAIFNGKFICATNGVCKFADSMNIFGRIPLKKIGEMLGIKKPELGKSDPDTGKTMFSKYGITADEINRCVTDCIITYEGLINIFHGASDIKITGPSLAMSYFRRFHQPYNIEYNENVMFFFDSYYGGRTEVFKIGKTHASVIDVNSMYPFVMKNAVFPNPKFLKVETNVNIKHFINQILNHYEGNIYCKVNHNTEKSYGFLPFRKSPAGGTGTGKLLFPVGRFSGCWNFPEIRYALEQGAITIEKIDKVVYSEKMPTPFESYVDTLFEQKVKAPNTFERERVKHLLTDLYGKFAQRIDEEWIYIDDIDKHYEYIRELQLNGKFIKLVMFNPQRVDAFLVTTNSKGYTIPHQIPSFASYITSLARVHLLKQINLLDSRKVVYCDTDSVFFEVAEGIKDEFHLGGWKLEPKIVTEIRGLKNYSYFKTDKPDLLIERIKGVPAKAIKGHDGVYRYQNLMNTKEALRRGLQPGILTERTKIIRGVYDKRIVLENGDTLPITI